MSLIIATNKNELYIIYYIIYNRNR